MRTEGGEEVTEKAVPDTGRRSRGERGEYFETTLSILGYQDEGEWVALALEMDLRGYGDTWEEALDDLRDLVLMQISFAHFKGQPELIWKSAEESYWQMFREVQRSRIFEAVTDEPVAAEAQRHAGGLVVPPPHVIAAHRNRFSRANG